MLVKELKELLDKYPDDMELTLWRVGYYKSVERVRLIPLKKHDKYYAIWNYNCNSETTCLVLE